MAKYTFGAYAFVCCGFLMAAAGWGFQIQAKNCFYIEHNCDHDDIPLD